jgi:hypothetical protein
VSTERALAVVVLVVSGLLLLRLGPGAIQSWRIYRGTGRRRQEDARASAPPTPPGVADRLALLAVEGYREIGVTRLVLPVGVRFAWIVAADDGDSYAILAGATAGPGLTGIYSAWRDGTWLGTLHPIGQATDRGGLQVRIVSTTLADAVRTHREGLARLTAVHGPPRQIRSMAEMLALDADYRTRFGGSRLRPITVRIMLPAVGVAVMFVVGLVLLAVSPT